jgi:PAS domain S-box-containing protein
MNKQSNNKNHQYDTIQLQSSHLVYVNKLFKEDKIDEKTLAKWLEYIVHQLQGDEGAIFTLNADGLLCTVTTGTTSLVEGRRISKEIGLGAWLLESRKPAFLPEVHKDIRFDTKHNIFDPIPESIVAAPILFKEDAFGIIQVNRRKEGNPFRAEHAEKLFDVSNIFGLFLYIFSIKEREKKRKKEEKLRRIEEQLSFEIATNAIPIGFFLVNDDFRILFANQFAVKTIGMDQDAVIGKSCKDIILSNDRKGDVPLLDDFFSTFPEKNLFQSPLHLLRRDGHEITVAFGLSPFSFKDTSYAVIYFTNPAEWEMVYSKEDEFITNVAHELRTPLFAILGSLSILEAELERQQNMPPTINSFVNIIREEGEKFTNILNALLDFDEVSKWNIGLKRETILILDLVRKIASDFEQKASEKNISIKVNLPSDAIHISADKLALQYAISHILDNAIKFNKPGGKVELYTEGLILRDSSWNFELHIEDTGVGIERSEIPYLFGKFYRVEKKIHTISGFGLGLTIVKDIIEMHGGNITIESEKGEGTMVTIQLPTMEI